MATADENPQASHLASRGVLMCVKCGMIARSGVTQPEAPAPACTVCGQPVTPYVAADNPVGSDPRNALWGFLPGGF